MKKIKYNVELVVEIEFDDTTDENQVVDEIVQGLVRHPIISDQLIRGRIANMLGIHPDKLMMEMERIEKYLREDAPDLFQVLSYGMYGEMYAGQSVITDEMKKRLVLTIAEAKCKSIED